MRPLSTACAATPSASRGHAARKEGRQDVSRPFRFGVAATVLSVLREFFSFVFPTFVEPRPVDQFTPSNLLRAANRTLNCLTVHHLLKDFNGRVRRRFTVSPKYPFRFAVGSKRIRRLNGTLNTVRRRNILVRRDNPVVNLTTIKQLIYGRTSNCPPTFATGLCRFTYHKVFHRVMSSRPNASVLGRLIRVLVT